MSGDIGITGSQLRRWRETKNLSRSQLMALLPSPHCAKSTNALASYENKPDKFVPRWLTQPLSFGGERHVTIRCVCDLFEWAYNDSRGHEQEEPRLAIIEDFEESDPPVGVCDVDEATFICQLLTRQGYECTPGVVASWLSGAESPPVDVAGTLSSIKSNLAYLVRAAQAESVVTGMFGSMSLGSILKDEPIDRKVQSDAEIRRALGERAIEFVNPIRLPHRYWIILEQLCNAVRMSTGEFINLWLERSLETVLLATKIKTKYDSLGIQKTRRKLFKFDIKRATLSTVGRPATVVTKRGK